MIHGKVVSLLKNIHLKWLVKYESLSIDWHCVHRSDFDKRFGVFDFLDGEVRHVEFEMATSNVFLITLSLQSQMDFEISGRHFTANEGGNMRILKCFGG